MYSAIDVARFRGWLESGLDEKVKVFPIETHELTSSPFNSSYVLRP
jgi:hypothetical protein